jgi:hypothetical protein
MTVKQAQEIVARYRVWPFQRLNGEQMKELEKAYKVLRENAKEVWMEQAEEGRF